MTSPLPNVPAALRPDLPQPAPRSAQTKLWECAVSGALLLVGAGMAYGALGIPSEAGYGGVGANFLPWVVALALMACGGVLLWHALSGGFRDLEDEPGDDLQPDWLGFVWVSAGLLLNAALIERIGFILSCALAYVLAVQGLRRAFGHRHDTWIADVCWGVAISAPVYWLFTKALSINLPGLTATGWL